MVKNIEDVRVQDMMDAQHIHLFLDDVRDVIRTIGEPNEDELFVVCRDDNQFKQFVSAYHEHIYKYHFDHDLGIGLMSGHELAKWMIEFFQDEEFYEKINFSVHSANPVGAENITKTIEGWNKYVTKT